MFLTSIVIDGFKSYAQRTELNELDREFNAITGLNGSGKSNVFDAICFVLGISNLGSVRATSLQDLVYKNGKEGITRAQVILRFNNRDKSKSPSGYSACDEINISREMIIGKQPKYYINNSSSTTKRIHDFFKSCGLNVNCPHFLIMQGQITKVLNMQSSEILATIEEAASTSIYAEKRENYRKMELKKELKLFDIDKNLNEKLLPSLKRFEEDRKSYVKYRDLVSSIEKFQNIKMIQTTKAYKSKLVELDGHKLKHNEDIKELKESLICESAKKTKLFEDIQETELQLASFKKSELEEYNIGTDLLKKNIANKEAEMNVLNENMNSVASSIKNIDQDIKSFKIKSEKLIERLKTIQGDDSGDNKQKRFDLLHKEIEQLEEKLQLICTGKVKDERGAEISIDEKISELKSNLCNIDIKISSMKAEIDTLEKKLGGAYREQKAKNSSQAKNLMEKHKQLTEKLQNSSDNFEEYRKMESKINDLKSKCRAIEVEQNKISDDISSIKSKNYHFDFKFSIPKSTQYNPSNYIGQVYELFTVKDQRFIKALATISGNRLFNVVTEDNETASLIMKEGKLRSRTNFLPLNKIRSKPIGHNAFKRAKELVGQDNVFSPIDILEFDPKFRPIIELVFCSAMVCKDMTQAKILAYDKQVNCNQVTLDGEFFSPFGTVTGGKSSKNSTYSPLSIADKLNKLISDKKSKESQIVAIRKEIDAHSQKHKQLESLNSQYEALANEIKKIECDPNFFSHKDIDRTISELNQDLSHRKAKLNDIIGEKNQVNKLLDELLEKKQTLPTKDDIAAVKQQIAAKKSEEIKLKKKYQVEINEYENLNNELVSIKNKINQLHEELEQKNQTSKKLEDIKNNIDSDILKLNEDNRSIEMKIEKILNENSELSKKLNNLVESHALLSSKITEISENLELQIQQLANFESEEKKIRSELTKMSKDHPWIAEQDFGGCYSQVAYESNSLTLTEVNKKLDEMKAQRDQLNRKINHTVMSSLDKLHNEIEELNKKRKIVHKDKQSISKSIEILDEKKKIFLEKAVGVINKSFSDIFSTLLPGADCKLVSLKNENTASIIGVEIKVCLGGLWKDNLIELSGGQRSLVALSLILAILKFKPAPLYILDEVDAALDPSHTQNIGLMIQQHFKGSQFLIISLKEGMFTNSNVLFKVKLDNGISAVNRQAKI
ncbi:MAG: Structural maintenance of chromosomes protein 2 [Marteilia pararefringens]